MKFCTQQQILNWMNVTCHVIKNEKVALDRLWLRQNVFLVFLIFVVFVEENVLLSRDAMHKRGICRPCRHAVSVCLSVRLSVTFVDHVKTNKHIFEIFSPSGSHTIIVFAHQTGWRYSDGGAECKWIWKIIFDQYLAITQKGCEIEPYLLWKANRKPHPSFRMVPLWMTLSDL